MSKFLTILVLTILLSSCGILKNTPSTNLSEGFYSDKTQSNEKVYVRSDEDVISIYPTKDEGGKLKVDTAELIYQFHQEKANNSNDMVELKSSSFDLDFIAVPLKYRPPQAGVPAQLNTEINASIYLGLRTDRYSIGYELNPLGEKDRKIKHFGFSLGVLTGFGSSSINPTTTNDLLDQEYDGIVWSKGAGGIVALNNLTLGLAVGFDNLLDGNRSIWIYESKPWFGFTLGLNIN